VLTLEPEREERPAQRKILVVVRNGASLSGLHDCLPAATQDHRIEWTWTIEPGSRFAAGLADELRRVGLHPTPWSTVLGKRFDLCIAAQASPQLALIDAPRLVVPHGVGFNRRNPERTGDTTSPVGCSRQELMVDGRVVPDHIGISDECLLPQLEAVCPEAVDRVFVMGDPAWDRMVAGRRLRERLRARLGVRPGQRVVVVNTTWNDDTSLWGQGDHVLQRLLAQLPADEFRVLLITHPNLHAQHSRYHLEGLLADARAAGLLSVVPYSDWHAAVLVADVAVGDHGSVSVYLAALGVPFLRAGDGVAELVTGSTTRRFHDETTALDVRGDLHKLLDSTTTPDEAAVRAAGAPLFRHQGQALDLLQRKVYQVLGLTPEGRPRPKPLAPVFVRPTHPCTAHHVVAAVDERAAEVVLRRFPAAVADFGLHSVRQERFLVAEHTEHDEVVLQNADVVVDDDRGGDPYQRVDVLLAAMFCSLAGATVDDCLVLRSCEGAAWRVRWRGAQGEAVLVASAVRAWVVARHPHTGDFRFTARAGDIRAEVFGRSIPWTG
jgi:hypothetical protein